MGVAKCRSWLRINVPSQAEHPIWIITRALKAAAILSLNMTNPPKLKYLNVRRFHYEI